jgi:hypothetical protein
VDPPSIGPDHLPSLLKDRSILGHYRAEQAVRLRRRAKIDAVDGHPRRITMDKKAKNPKKPKQTKTKDGAGKAK